MRLPLPGKNPQRDGVLLAPRHAPPLAAASQPGIASGRTTSSRKNRVGVFGRCPSGRTGSARRARRGTAPSCNACTYKVASGRTFFLNADPIGFRGGSNWYRYANGNPIMFNDPFGLCPGSSGSPSIGSQLGSAFGASNPYNPLAIANYVAGRVLSFPGAVMSAVGMTQADQDALAIVTMQPELMLVDTSAIGTQLSAKLQIGQTFEGLAGTPMTGWTRHGLNQSISRDAGLGVSTQAIFDALTNPVEIKVTATGSEYIGANARVVLNADGKMITTTATSQAGTRVGAQTSTVTTR